MIDIIEKEPHESLSAFGRSYVLYPTYMVKDGKERFMFNRREPLDKREKRTDEERKNFLISTGGKYFVFHSQFTDPFEMIADIAKQKHSFTYKEIERVVKIESGGLFVDFHGNRRELSAAFFYRIYDEAMAAEIKELVEMIFAKDYEAVTKKLQSRKAADI